MKHEESLSTTRYSFEHYADYLRCVDAFYEIAEKNMAAALGDEFCDTYLRSYLTHCAQQGLNGHSTEEDMRRLVALAADICARHKSFERVPEGSSMAAQYAGLFILQRVLEDTVPSMLQRFVNAFNATLEQSTTGKYAEVRQNGTAPVCFDTYDARQRLLRARYLFCGEHPEERYTHAGRPLKAAFAKNRLEYQDKDFAVLERILWLPVPAGNEGLLELHLHGREAGLHRSPEELRRAFSSPPPDERDLPVEARVLRKFVQSPAASRFHNAWLFMDRNTEADDNAEHLYRWVAKHHPEINAWFVLNEDSHDWPRLASEGFRLIAHGSMEHKALFLACRNLVSSQMDEYVFAPLEAQYFADLRETKFICLDHGVIKEDMSPWLNTVEMDLFVTSTEGECRSIAGDGAPYALTAKEVVRSGLPRHDSLREAGQAEKSIFIMPTWRTNLTGAWDGAGQRREYNPAFMESRFARAWKSLLSSAVLETLCRRYGYEPVFWPHPGFREYLPDFDLPAHIRIPAGESIQTLLKKSALLITDFSSIAFDMALLRRPALYYHFESHDCYLKAQGRRNSYFQYDRDGFGPVCHTEEQVLAALECSLAAGCRPEPAYLERMEQTLDLNDGQCCRRTFEAILAASKPFLPE
jgi:CDP-glycerol glycerophosphotransferase (TagB/SpsB family)